MESTYKLMHIQTGRDLIQEKTFEETKFFPGLEHLDEFLLIFSAVSCPLHHQSNHVLQLLGEVTDVCSLHVFYNMVHDVDVFILAILFLLSDRTAVVSRDSFDSQLSEPTQLLT